MTHYLLRSIMSPLDSKHPNLYACDIWRNGFVQHAGHPDVNGQQILLLSESQYKQVMQHKINHSREVIRIESITALPADVKPEHVKNIGVLMREAA